MSDTPEEQSPDPEVVQVAPDTPVREVEPLTMFAPNVGDPVASMDFRPQGTFVFKDEEKDHESDKPNDDALEDGHGNFRHPSQTVPKHPSEPRTPQPYEGEQPTIDRRENGNATEEPQEAPDSTSSQQGLPFGS